MVLRLPAGLWVAVISALYAGCSPQGASTRGNGTAGAGADPTTTGGSGGGPGTGTTGGTTTGGGGTSIVITLPEGGLDAKLLEEAEACSTIRLETEVKVITTTVEKVVQVPVDLYFMVDKSTSMLEIDQGNTVDRWTALTTAIGQFVDSASNPDASVPTDDGGTASMGVGMAFFPVAGLFGVLGSCTVADYAAAIVPVAPLPGNAAPVKTAFASQTALPNTPTLPAIQGAIQYATSYQMANPTRRVVIVLATDGEPNLCNSTVQAVADEAARAFGQMPPLSTYVLGIGPSTGNLNTIAQAGGTKTAFMVTSSGADQLLMALNAIRTQVQTTTTTTTVAGTKIACTQPLDPSQRELDWAAARISREANKITTPVPPVADAAACGRSEGWYYDNPKAPTQLVFCPVTCEGLSPETGISRVNVDIPCVLPPRKPPS